MRVSQPECLGRDAHPRHLPQAGGEAWRFLPFAGREQKGFFLVPRPLAGGVRGGPFDLASSTAVRRAVSRSGDAISIATHSAGPLLQAHRLGDIARAGKAPGRSTSRVFWGRRAMTERLALASGRGRSLAAPVHFPTSPLPATPARFFRIVGNILIRHAIRGGKSHCELHSPCVNTREVGEEAA